MKELKPFFTFLGSVKYTSELASHQDWTRAEGLPEGWMKRTSEGASNHVLFLSPQGRVFHNKASVTMFLNGGPVDEEVLGEAKEKRGSSSRSKVCSMGREKGKSREGTGRVEKVEE